MTVCMVSDNQHNKYNLWPVSRSLKITFWTQKAIVCIQCSSVDAIYCFILLSQFAPMWFCVDYQEMKKALEGTRIQTIL